MIVATVLGCGTSTGVPIIGCKCKVCRSANPKNHRLRASIWLQLKKHRRWTSIVVDTSTDFRAQALRSKIKRVDAVLYTHPHADHVQGIDELRCYNYAQQQKIDVYGNKWTLDSLNQRFGYIFQPGPVEGGGIPRLRPRLIGPQARSIQIDGHQIVPLHVQHGSKECLGFRVGRFAYITDCSSIPDRTMKRLVDLDVLILDCVRLKPHRTHFNLENALKAVEEIGPRKTILTHLGHDFDYIAWKKRLPKGVSMAYDGLRVKI